MRLRSSWVVRLVASSLVLLIAGLDTAVGGASEVRRSEMYVAGISVALPVALDQESQKVPAETVLSTQQNSVPPSQGTAAAPDMRPEGSPASRPAGAAVAVAKQRRTHSFAIRVGLLVGAGIAIGTVVALSAGSSGRPH